ncbi:MAG: 30S ribosomal protein S18 [Phycisphaerae bacterium]|nr:30S ribosomal protein S18 [Phycisphaerae bacterium]
MAMQRQKRPNRFREQHRCRFGNDPSKVDYKDIDTLSKMVTSQGKMFSRKRSGNSARCQRAVKLAIKRARYLALLPYVG